MRNTILFLGQKWLGEICFKLLQEAQNDNLKIVGIVSNQTSHVWWKSNLIYQRSIQDDVPFIDNAQRNNDKIINLIAKFNVNTIISVQHPWLLPREILSKVEYNALNLHNAKIPEYRGNNTVNHAILNGETKYYSTIHWMVDEADSGAIAFEKSITISPDDTARSLYDKSLITGEETFRDLLDHFQNKKKIPRREIQGTKRYYPRNSLDGLREIKNVGDFDEVDKKSRAFFFPPFEPSYFLNNAKKFYVFPEKIFEYTHEYQKHLSK